MFKFTALINCYSVISVQIMNEPNKKFKAQIKVKTKKYHYFAYYTN